MGKKSPSVPKPPDPVKTAQAQADANKEALQESARINAVNLYGPQGSVTYQKDANGVPTSQYTNLSAQGQQLYDSQQGIAQALANAAWGKIGQAPMDTFSLAGLGYNPMGYNTSAMPTFNPASLPVGAAPYYGGNPTQTGQGVFGGYSGGKGMPQQMPQPGQQPQQTNSITDGVPYPGTAAYNAMPNNGIKNAAQQQWGSFQNDLTNSRAAYDQNVDAWGKIQTAWDKQQAQQSRLHNPATWDGESGTYYGGNTNSKTGSAGQQPPAPDTGPTQAFIDKMRTPKSFGNLNKEGVNYTGPLGGPGQYQAPTFSGQAPAGFNGEQYLAANPDVTGDPWAHFAQYGINEGRRIAPIDEQQQAPQSPQQQSLPPQAAYNQPSGGKGTPQQMPSPYGQQQPQGQGLNVLPYDPRSYGNIDSFVNQTQDAVFDQQMRNLQPQIDMQYSRQMQDLADRGLPVGGEAYNKAVGELNRNIGNQYQQAANQAIAAGGEEANRRLGMEQGLRGTAWTEALGQHQTNMADTMQRIQTEQSLRNQAIQEQLMGRTQAFNEASAILQGSPALQMMQAPQMPTYNLQAPDVIGATMGAYNAQMNAYNAQAAQSASSWQGAGQLASGLGSIAMKSSLDYKEDRGPAERIIDRVRLMPIETWRYKREIDPAQELHIGPYAEHFKALFGLGNGSEIQVVDAVGILFKSVQDLADDVDVIKNSLVKKPVKRKKSTTRAKTPAKTTRKTTRRKAA